MPNPDIIRSIIAQGEGVEVEFKKSRASLSRSVFETICSFLNRRGGHILLGVADDGRIEGIKEDTVQEQLETLAKDLNDPQIISPTPHLSAEVIEMEGKRLIYIYVPESAQPHAYRGVFYDRNQDGDIRLTNQQKISDLFLRKKDSLK